MNFNLDTDNDGIPNILDTDDDNDGVLDNDDFKPLDGSVTQRTLQTLTLLAVADAPLRSNTTGNAQTNYGTDTAAETRNDARKLLVKFDLNSNLDIRAARLKLFSSTENDLVQAYSVPDSSWSETTITANNANLSGSVFVGSQTLVPDSYTTISLSKIPITGQANSYYIIDPGDPNGSIEEIYTKETAGKGPSLELDYFEIPTPKVLVELPPSIAIYEQGSPVSLGFSLSQQPSDTVYVPISTSDSSVATISGSSVLVFDSSNWDQRQYINILPVNNGLPDGNRDFSVLIEPLHSNDSNFNGFNQEDINGFRVQTTRLTNLSSLTVTAGEVFNLQLIPESTQSATFSRHLQDLQFS